jgi:LacI family transcriptional regulator
MNQPISLEKIATMSGVSTATVSRTLNGHPGVSEAKRKEIKEIVGKLGQPPRRRPRSARNGTICLLQTDDGYQSAAELFVRQLHAVSQTAARHGFDVALAFGNQPEILPPCIKERQVAGVLIYGGRASDSVTEALQGLPSVWVASHSKLPHNMVMSGNEEAGQLAARHLIQQGHKHLGCLYPYEHHVMDARLFAFSTYAMAHGHTAIRYTSVPAQKDPHKPHQWYETILTPIVEKWSATRPRPTGLFSPDDAITAHLYPLLKRRGIKIGKDVTIISFGNEFSYLAGLDPRPASIDIGSETLGMQAIEMLCRAIRTPSGDERGIRVSIQPVLEGVGVA